MNTTTATAHKQACTHTYLENYKYIQQFNYSILEEKKHKISKLSFVIST